MKTPFENNLQKRIDFLQAEKEEVENTIFKESNVREFANLHLKKTMFEIKISELKWVKKQYQDVQEECKDPLQLAHEIFYPKKKESKPLPPPARDGFGKPHKHKL